MSEIALEMNHVYKKFTKGELYGSLRDLIPALTGKLLRNKKNAQLETREFWALHDIDFEIKRGEAVGIIGHNGAGKSTVLKILGGIMKPTKGDLAVKGKLSALIEVGAGFHNDLTGRENIYLNGTILGMTKNEIRRKLDEIVAFSGLEEFIDTPVKRYSSGMYARLGFSVAAHVEPDVLIIDEVLSVGDALFQKRCLEKMSSVIKGGATVIFVSHNLKAVADLCQRSILLNHGRVLEEGPTNQVIRRYLDRVSEEDRDTTKTPSYVSKVTVRGKDGEDIQFRSGQKAWVDVEVKANSKCEKLAVVLWVKDDNYYLIFDTSTERLGHGTFSLNPGDTFKCTFELDLNVAQGTFYFTVALFRYDIQKTYDTYFPAATIYVNPEYDVRGVVNMRPKVVEHQLLPADRAISMAPK